MLQLYNDCLIINPVCFFFFFLEAEPFPWKRSINRSVSSSKFQFYDFQLLFEVQFIRFINFFLCLLIALDTGSSLSLICELQNDKVIPVNIDFSQTLSTGDVVSCINDGHKYKLRIEKVVFVPSINYFTSWITFLCPAFGV